MTGKFGGVGLESCCRLLQVDGLDILNKMRLFFKSGNGLNFINLLMSYQLAFYFY